MTEDDIGFRNLTYARFVELGRAPTADEISAASGSAQQADGGESRPRAVEPCHGGGAVTPQVLP